MDTEETYISTEKLRVKLRTYAQAQRANKRECEMDSLRLGLGEIQSMVTENLTANDVTGLAGRIKRRKHATIEDMFRLNHAFLQNNENIVTFSNIPGAIQILVKEFTGKDAAQQIAACETLCNLSLGDDHVCEKIASIAGTYLMTYLESSDLRLKRTTLWVISNLTSTGGKGLKCLAILEIFPKILGLYLSETETSSDVATVLDLLTGSQYKELRPDDKLLLFEKFHLKKPESPGAEYHLKVVFQAELITPDIPMSGHQLDYLVCFAYWNIINTPDISTDSNILRILYSIRVLANLLAAHPNVATLLAEKAQQFGKSVLDIFNVLFSHNSREITQESLWLVGNYVEFADSNSNTQTFVNNLKIQRSLCN